MWISGAALADVPALDPDDPTAEALGYVLDSGRPDSTCGNCRQFQGNAGHATCTFFPGKHVQAGGWCLNWVKRPA
jgi:hypothetical protein